MRVLLVTAEPGPFETLVENGLASPFAETLTAGPGDLLEAYDVTIDADGLDRAPRVARDRRLALVCTDLDTVLRLAPLDSDAEIIFMPSTLARIEAERRCRKTLIAARTLPAGALLMLEDIATELGGTGIAEHLATEVVGRPLLYPLKAGQPVDFGTVEIVT